MATSGSYNYSLTAADIIQAALEDIQVFQSGETVDSADQTIALRTLNLLVKQWSGTADGAAGLKVFSRQRVFLFPQANKARYLIGPASSDDRATTQYGKTTLSAAEAAGQTVLSITSNTDTTTFPGTTVTMTASDLVGIELDSGSIEWTTISGTPGATMTIAVALTGAAASGNYVYWFTSRAQRFVDLESAILQDLDTSADTPLYVYREVSEYENLPQKNSDGDPSALLNEPSLLNNAITLDSYPNDMHKVLRLTVLYPTEDYDATTNDIAYPQTWLAALEWELALRLCAKFQKGWSNEMQLNYNNAVGIARNYTPINSAGYFQPGLE